MKIDRAAFLLLTGSIAAGACVEQPPNAPTVDIALPYASAAPPAERNASAEAAPLAVATSGASSTPLSPSREGDSADEGAYPAGEAGGSADPGFCGQSHAQFDPKRTGCSDAVGNPASCKAMAAPRGCGSFPFPRAKCDGFAASMKPKIAERAVACAVALSAKDVCDACLTYRCGYEALMTACVDPAADTDCAAIVKSCASPTPSPTQVTPRRAPSHAHPAVAMSECRAYLSGLTPSGRRKMVQCMVPAQGCDWGLYSCAEGL
jgi:hypothetical protein